MSGAGTESLADCQKSFRRTFCSELVAVVSLLYYFLCVIMILTAVAGVIVGLVNISASERVSHFRIRALKLNAMTGSCVFSWLHLKQNTDRLQRVRKLRTYTKKVLLREARTAATNTVRSSS